MLEACIVLVKYECFYPSHLEFPAFVIDEPYTRELLKHCTQSHFSLTFLTMFNANFRRLFASRLKFKGR